jgi:hypothetical protein
LGLTSAFRRGLGQAFEAWCRPACSEVAVIFNDGSD